MLEIGNGAPASNEFIIEVRDSYLSLWKNTEDIPSVLDIEEDMCDFVTGMAVDDADREHIHDSDYWENDDYRSEIIGDYLSAVYDSEDFMSIEDTIIECLKWLNYAAIMDNTVDEQYIRHVNESQLYLIPDEFGECEEGGI